MKNGATIILEASWAINLLDATEANCTLAGTKGGADMKNGLRINGEKNSTLYVQEVQTSGGGVAYFDSKGVDLALEEARSWINAVRNDTDPVVLPEQALVVSEILEAIYDSAKSGQPVTFDR